MFASIAQHYNWQAAVTYFSNKMATEDDPDSGRFRDAYERLQLDLVFKF